MLAAMDYDLFTVASVCGNSSPGIHLPQTRLSSITTSSQEAGPGALFVPLTDKRDGHDFIHDALDRGASAYFLRKNHPVRKKLSRAALALAIEVEDPLLALGRLAHFHRRRFAPLVIAATGSNGKTTTKEMLRQIFGHALGDMVMATEENYNNHIGVPFTLFRIHGKTRVAIVEMGMNHAGEIDYLSRMAEPHVAVISSIGHAHIEFFKSRVGIARAKAEVMNGMHTGGRLYIPPKISERQTLERLARTRRVSVKPVSLRYADLFGPNAAWASNFALAASVAEDAGIGKEHIAYVARNFKPAEGRMQLRQGKLTVIDDGYNANPDSAVASVDSAIQIAAARPVVCIFGDFKELGKFSRALHAWTGKAAAKKGVAAFYGVGKDMKYAVEAFRKATGGRKRSHFFQRGEVKKLVEQIQSESRESVILIKGSRSMKMEEIVELIL